MAATPVEQLEDLQLGAKLNILAAIICLNPRILPRGVGIARLFVARGGVGTLLFEAQRDTMYQWQLRSYNALDSDRMRKRPASSSSLQGRPSPRLSFAADSYTFDRLNNRIVKVGES